MRGVRFRYFFSWSSARIHKSDIPSDFYHKPALPQISFEDHLEILSVQPVHMPCVYSVSRIHSLLLPLLHHMLLVVIWLL